MPRPRSRVPHRGPRSPSLSRPRALGEPWPISPACRIRPPWTSRWRARERAWQEAPRRGNNGPDPSIEGGKGHRRRVEHVHLELIAFALEYPALDLAVVAEPARAVTAAHDQRVHSRVEHLDEAAQHGLQRQACELRGKRCTGLHGLLCERRRLHEVEIKTVRQVSNDERQVAHARYGYLHGATNPVRFLVRAACRSMST